MTRFEKLVDLSVPTLAQLRKETYIKDSDEQFSEAIKNIREDQRERLREGIKNKDKAYKIEYKLPQKYNAGVECFISSPITVDLSMSAEEKDA